MLKIRYGRDLAGFLLRIGYCARRRSGRLVIYALVLAAWLPCTGFAASILRVKASATGANNGTSWANAYVDLQAALAAAKPGDEIWVAAGTYIPINYYDPNKSFALVNGTALYGGFAGTTETLREQRDWKAHQTILSGEIGDPGDLTDNSYTVVKGGDNVTLDGFTVTGAYPNRDSVGGGMYNVKGAVTVANCNISSNSAHSGGGMYNGNGPVTVTNCTFNGNSAFGDWPYQYSGGGILCGSTTIVTSCTFRGNTAASAGGAIAGGNSSVVNCTFIGNSAGKGGGIATQGTVSNCTFIDNRADGYFDGYGGGIYIENPAIVTNCAFRNNVAALMGGAMVNYGATVTNCVFSGNWVFRMDNRPKYGGGGIYAVGSAKVTNCTFSGNWTPLGGYGGGIFNGGGSPIITNCIIWANNATTGPEIYRNDGSPTFIHCDIAGFRGIGAINDGTRGNDGGGNIEADPKFLNFSNPLGLDNRWRTRDDGLMLPSNSPCINAGTATGAPATDILGNPHDGLPDIGAYEYMVYSPILRYLLGLDPDPTGLDANGDGQVDIADLVKSLKAPH